MDLSYDGAGRRAPGAGGSVSLKTTSKYIINILPRDFVLPPAAFNHFLRLLSLLSPAFPLAVNAIVLLGKLKSP